MSGASGKDQASKASGKDQPSRASGQHEESSSSGKVKKRPAGPPEQGGFRPGLCGCVCKIGGMLTFPPHMVCRHNFTVRCACMSCPEGDGSGRLGRCGIKLTDFALALTGPMCEDCGEWHGVQGGVFGVWWKKPDQDSDKDKDEEEDKASDKDSKKTLVLGGEEKKRKVEQKMPSGKEGKVDSTAARTASKVEKREEMGFDLAAAERECPSGWEWWARELRDNHKRGDNFGEWAVPWLAGEPTYPFNEDSRASGEDQESGAFGKD